MNTKVPFFLELVAEHIHKNYAGQSDSLCVVIPNRRGALYLKKHLGAFVDGFDWVPEIMAAENFIETLSGIPTGGELTLTFDLYEAYLKTVKGEAVSFEQFLRWAPQVMQDFNEVDRYLVDSEKVFENLKSIKEIENWSLSGEKLSPMQEKYLAFMQQMGAVYKELKKNVLEKNYCWQGLSYRIAHDKLIAEGYKLPYKKIILAGFNAVNLAEEKIITYLVENKIAGLLWDADNYYLKNHEQEAGLFLRRHLTKFKPVEGFITDNLSQHEKQVEITGVAGRMAQVAAGAQMIEKAIANNSALDKTAVVLCDETLLLPMLSVLPKAVQSVNVTLEYPAAITPLFDLYEHILQMQLNKKDGKKENAFYFKEVLAVLYNPFFADLWEDNFFIKEVIRKLNRSNAVYIRTGLLKSWFGENFSNAETVFTGFGSAYVAVKELCKINGRIIEKLHIKVNRSIELETALAFMKELNALQNALEKYPEINLRGLRVLLKQVLAGSGIPFYGEPLSGLQVMGVLETRTLDFDNVIMLSVNEGVLPSGKSSNSFIPDDLKRHLQMPLHNEKDAIYSYHFYRILQRAKNVTLIYNTETDTFGKGEKSRFITQLLSEWKKINPLIKMEEKILSLPVTAAGQNFGVIIEKDENVLAKLLEKAQSERGLSPTSFNTYKECSLKFYLRFIAGVREADEVEEDIEASAMGNIIHETLENLFRPFENKNLVAIDIEQMRKQVPALAEQFFSAYYDEVVDDNGKKALALHVIKKYIFNLLNFEKKEIENRGKKQLIVKYLEKDLKAELTLPNGNKINILGKSDRIDDIDGELRIVDYKSSVNKYNDKFDISSLDEVFENTKYSKALQLLTYAWLAWKEKLAAAEKINPCIIAFRAEKSLYTLTQNKKEFIFSDSFFKEFEEKLKFFIAGMFNAEKKFEPTADLEICEYCAYKSICNRH
ncbi:MAG TPA: PD-(D/E)XK nuclease family protein [Bacteroidia bacterium]|jgi:ATP-dependent helicase/nuclease subunit B|nr:PD-(D/E)XK nuclease family protein [Bacteroidia bacterium]